VLRQPKEEQDAISKSLFAIVNPGAAEGRPIRISGTPLEIRQENLAQLAKLLARRFGDMNLIEQHWQRSERDWGIDALRDRRRALFVVNSYSDGVVFAATLGRVLSGGDLGAWKVLCLRPDIDDEPSIARINKVSGFASIAYHVL
jgi:hypothetical protein